MGSDFERLVGSKTEKVTEIMKIRIGENKGQLSTGKLFVMFVSFETSGETVDLVTLLLLSTFYIHKHRKGDSM